MLANGDVLTGTVMRLAADSAGDVPRVAVQVEGLLPLSGTTIDIRTNRIARIVTSVAALRETPVPGTVELADGRRFVARAIRWRPYGLSLLSEQGIVEANYAEIVDAVFLDIETEQAVLEDNVWAGGSRSATIVRFQTTSGAILTSSRASREEERSRRRSRPTRNVFYHVQPAWADQPIAIPEPEIAWCGYRRGDEAPLSLLPAKIITNQRLLGSPAPSEHNATERAELLAAGQQQSDLGVIAHSHSELAIDLPAEATSLSLSVGIDDSCGSGGCVKCRIAAESPDGKTLWESGFLRGSDGLRDVGQLDVAGLKRVVLIVEHAHDGRPAGADPLDIRDVVCWMTPLVRLDLDANEQGSRKWAMLAGLDGWQLGGDAWQYAELSSRWNSGIAAWDTVLTVRKRDYLGLTRRHYVSPTSDVLELRAACPSDLDEHDFTLKVNGEPVPWNTNADRKQLRDWVARYGRSRGREETGEVQLYDRLAYWWDLSRWRGQEVELELSLGGEQERNEIAWRGISLKSAVANLPDTAIPIASDVKLVSLKPIGTSSQRGRGDPVKDALPVGGRNPPPIRFLGQQFTGGYGFMRNSSIRFPLAPEYRKFVALAGCCSQVAGPLQVLIDDKVVWERPVLTSLQPAEQIALDIPAGAKTITLQTGAEGSYNGFSAFANAGFVTK